MDWLVPPGCAVAVDLAAGTGLFTRALLGRAVRVIAVEPDTRMREVLARRTAPRTAAGVRAWLDCARTITLPEGSQFGAGQTASFRFRRTMPLVDVLDWLATNSAFITACAPAGRRPRPAAATCLPAMR